MQSTVLGRSAGTLLVLALFMLGIAPTAAAQGSGRSVAWQRFDVDLAIQPDGSVKVSETQVIQFAGTYQQGFRLVPLDGQRSMTGVGVAETTGGQSMPYRRGTGQANTYSASTGDDGLEINWWFPPTTNATRAFTVLTRSQAPCASTTRAINSSGNRSTPIATEASAPAA